MQTNPALSLSAAGFITCWVQANKMYAVPALSLKSRQEDELNVCWNNVFRVIFNYNKWEYVKAVIVVLADLISSTDYAQEN